MTAVSTSINSTSGDVTISWTAPSDGSDALTEYFIELKKSDNTWHNSTICSGSNSLTTRSCNEPMTTMAGTLGLSFDTLIEVRASARNTFGWSPVSALNTAGAKVR
jgi:hypothetical protein